MTRTLLTDTKIKGLKPKKNAYYVWQASATRGTGRLGVKVYPSGRRVFVYRFFINDKAKFEQLGDYPTISLSKAEARARAFLDGLQTGEGVTFEPATITDLFTDYISNMKASGRRSWELNEKRLSKALDSIHINRQQAANSVTSTQIKLILADMLKRGANGGAHKLRATLHAAFNYGLYADNDPANATRRQQYGITVNPVSAIPTQPGAERALDRFLSWDELGKVLYLLDDADCWLRDDFVRLLLLCIYSGGQRPWEWVCNTRNNIDERAKTISIPPHISKTEDWHVVPLTDTAWAFLQAQLDASEGEFIFPARTKEGHILTTTFAIKLQKFCKMHDIEPFTPRDIRRTFKTLAGDMGLSIEIRDRIQNHKPAGVSARHYDRYYYLKEKREGLELWEKKLSQL